MSNNIVDLAKLGFSSGGIDGNDNQRTDLYSKECDEYCYVFAQDF